MKEQQSKTKKVYLCRTRREFVVLTDGQAKIYDEDEIMQKAHNGHFEKMKWELSTKDEYEVMDEDGNQL